MKPKIKKYVLLLSALLLFSQAKAQQDTLHFNGMRDFLNSVTQVFKNNHPELSFFKYHLISTDGNIYDFYKGKNDGTDSICNLLSYLNVVKDLELSNFNTTDSSINLAKLETKMFDYLSKGYTPISLSYVEYADFKDSTIFLNLIDFQNNQFQETVQNGYYPFVKKRLFAASALNHIIKTPQFNFYIDDDFIQSNIKEKIDAIYIDFDNSEGYVPVTKGELYQVTYANQGLKNCKVKIKSENEYFYSNFQIYDSTSVSSEQTRASSCSPTPPDVQPTYISTTYSNGHLIEGRYAIWYATCNIDRKIRKPYIISAGTNPGNGKQLVPFQVYPNDINIGVNGLTITIPVTYDWRGTYYETYNGAYNKRFSPNNAEGCDNGDRYLDRLREEGYDIVILMYDNGTDYLEYNAALMIKLINKINQEKVGHFENIVSGYSAGGVTSRLALALMEEQYKQGIGPHPHTKAWVSVETENQGINLPLGLQYLLDFQANSNNVLPMMGGLNFLQVTADAINQISATMAQGFNINPTVNELEVYTVAHPNGGNSSRISLLNQFATIAGNNSRGYPEFVRRIGVSQGSAIATHVPHDNAIIFDSQLKTDPFGNSYTTSDCQGSYTVYRPVASKTTTARHWGSNNTNNIFDGNVFINSNWTYMKRHCVEIHFLGNTYCSCSPAGVIYGATSVSDKHVAKPTITNNFDDVPASTQATQVEFYRTSVYGFYNSWFGGNSHAGYDHQLHGFVPTVSSLDLRNPVTGGQADNFTDPYSLGLMNINNINNTLNSQQFLRYGFPYLAHPNHYSYTPYDAVYAIGINNGTYSDGTTAKPANQFHVEDPQVFMGDYLARVEVAPEDLYLSNQTVGASASTFSGYTGGYTAEFEARNKIIIGKTDANGTDNIYSLYGNQDYLTPNGDFNVAQNAKAIVHSGEQIEFLPGTAIPPGAELEAYIQHYNCPDNLRSATNNTTNNSNTSNNAYVQNGINNPEEEKKTEVSANASQLKIYPNPNNGLLYVENTSEEKNTTLFITDLTGKVVYSSTIKNNQPNELNLQSLENGIYLLQIKNSKNMNHSKLILAR